MYKGFTDGGTSYSCAVGASDSKEEIKHDNTKAKVQLGLSVLAAPIVGTYEVIRSNCADDPVLGIGLSPFLWPLGAIDVIRRRALDIRVTKQALGEREEIEDELTSTVVEGEVID